MTRKQKRRWQKQINRRKAHVKARNIRRNTRQVSKLTRDYQAAQQVARYAFLRGLFS